MRIQVEVPELLWPRLTRLAEREVRSPRQQAEWLLREALAGEPFADGDELHARAALAVVGAEDED